MDDCQPRLWVMYWGHKNQAVTNFNYLGNRKFLRNLKIHGNNKGYFSEVEQGIKRSKNVLISKEEC